LKELHGKEQRGIVIMLARVRVFKSLRLSRLKNYPGMFDGTQDGLPKFYLNIDYRLYNNSHELRISDEYFVIWLAEKVQVDGNSA